MASILLSFLTMPSKKKRGSPAEPLMHGIYCHRYYTKNREQVNEKTRERMRRLRASDVTVPPEVLATRLEARRAAARKYRERNQWKLKLKAQESRAAAAEEHRRVNHECFRLQRNIVAPIPTALSSARMSTTRIAASWKTSHCATKKKYVSVATRIVTIRWGRMGEVPSVPFLWSSAAGDGIAGLR
ncbi:hypothetical protein B0H11DRAFT_1906988 [Mycena galericulata]|nr:hypothetical protein B0H11DRAFT_1906988 [Mycena galericulata]